MQTELVFLHIEKSAGTSQMKYFCDVLGVNNVYWHNAEIYNDQHTKSMYEFFLIGGHQSYAFYGKTDLIYTAVLRNPVDRILSLYEYYRKQSADYWEPLGLDVHSLKNTLKSCQAFRDQISGAQCGYLSGINLYANAIQTLFKGSYIVGCVDAINEFNLQIARSLELGYKELPSLNKGRENYLNDLDVDAECIEEIEALAWEDIKLYKFIFEDCKGLFSSVSDARWSKAKAAMRNLQHHAKLRPVFDILLHNQRITSSGFILLDAKVDGKTIVQSGDIINFNLEFSTERTMSLMEVGIEIFDSRGCLAFGSNSTSAGYSLKNVEPGIHRVNYALIADLPEGIYNASFTFTELLSGDFFELGRLGKPIEFTVTIARQSVSTGYLSLTSKIGFKKESDAAISLRGNYTGTINSLVKLDEVPAGEVFELPVQLQNDSDRDWVNFSAIHPINLCYHVLDLAGNCIEYDGARTKLVVKIPSKEAVDTVMSVVAPRIPGRYRLELVPVQEGTGWLDQMGFTPGTFELTVGVASTRTYLAETAQMGEHCWWQRDGSSMISSGNKGSLIFPLGSQLVQGRYIAHLKGTYEESGITGVWAEVCCNKGLKKFARREVGAPYKEGWIAELPFYLPADVYDLEVRLWITEDANVRVEELCIEPENALTLEQGETANAEISTETQLSTPKQVEMKTEKDKWQKFWRL